MSFPHNNVSVNVVPYTSTPGPYEARTYQTTTILPYQHACWFSESQIENYLSEPLYILRHTGIITEAPPLYNDKNNIHQLVRILTYDYPGRRVETAGKYGSMFDYLRDVTELNLDRASLYEDAIYIKELDISVALARHRERLPVVHPSFTNIAESQYKKSLQDLCDKNVTSPFTVAINDPDTSHDRYYIVINGIMTSYPISHALPEISFSIYFRSYDEDTTDGVDKHKPATVVELPAAVLLSAGMEVTVDSENNTTTTWHMGTSAVRVRELHRKYMTALNSRYTEADLQARIKDDNNVKSEEIRILKQEKDRLVAELNTSKLTLKTKTEEIDQYRTNNEQTYEREKWEWEREKHRLCEEREALKHQQNYHVQELKVKKEEISTKSSEVSFLASAAKALAVAIPVCAAVAFGVQGWLAKAVTTTVGRCIGGLLSLFSIF